MSSRPPGEVVVRSRDNSAVKLLRQLSAHSGAYRKLGQFWVEGDHLCGAALQRHVVPAMAVFGESYWPSAPATWVHAAARTVVLSDPLFDEISGLQSAARVGFLIDLPSVRRPQAGLASVILDRIQDAGNVGSILRSAAAFGVRQVLALKGTAALWSPKVLRAGMGAHFALELVEGLHLSDVLALAVPLIVTSSHHGGLLELQALPSPCAWAFGHEGQGLAADLLAAAALSVRIGQPGGEESLNVAAAAAICLHAGSVARPFQLMAGRPAGVAGLQ